MSYRIVYFNSQYLQWNNWNAPVHACAVTNNDYRHMNWNIIIENITPNYQTWAEYFFKFYSFWMCVHEKDVVFPKFNYLMQWKINQPYYNWIEPYAIHTHTHTHVCELNY